MSFLPDIEFQDQSVIKKFQEEKLQEALKYLQQRSPFYRNLFARENINIEKIKKQFKEDLVVGDNFLIFDSNILTGFFDKYIKISFNELFDIDEYKERIQNLLKNIDDKNENRKISKKFMNYINHLILMRIFMTKIKKY